MTMKEHLSWDDKKIDSEIERITNLLVSKSSDKSQSKLALITKEAQAYRTKNRRWNDELDRWEDNSTGKVWDDDEQFELAGKRLNMKLYGVESPSQTIEYLRSLKDYNKHVRYKEDGNIASLGIGLNTYNQKKASSLERDQYTVGDDGITKYEAEFDDKLEEKRQNLDSLYQGSIYLKDRKTNLNKKIQEKSKADKIKSAEAIRQEQLRKQISTQREVDEQLNRSKYLDVSPGGTLGIRNRKDNFPLSESLRNSLGITLGATDGG